MVSAKYSALLSQIRSIAEDRPIVVAFSGGVDSTFLLRACIDAVGSRTHAITCVSATMAKAEAADARALAIELGLGERHHVVASNELERENFSANPTNRCALCKTELLAHAIPLAKSLHANAAIVLGTNTDDLGDYRPGIAAAAEHGARSPMVDVGLSKQEIRDLSRELGLRTWNKPQLACLSSRFPHGTEITVERLSRVDNFENDLRSLGFFQLRVRFHDEIARLELAADDIARATMQPLREQISALGKSHGFRFVVVDLDGFRSGSLNPPSLLQLGRKRELPSQ